LIPKARLGARRVPATFSQITRRIATNGAAHQTAILGAESELAAGRIEHWRSSGFVYKMSATVKENPNYCAPAAVLKRGQLSPKERTDTQMTKIIDNGLRAAVNKLHTP
jgi:hypothetical protein